MEGEEMVGGRSMMDDWRVNSECGLRPGGDIKAYAPEGIGNAECRINERPALKIEVGRIRSWKVEI